MSEQQTPSVGEASYWQDQAKYWEEVSDALRARVAELEADAARFRWCVDNLGWRAWHQSPANIFASGLSDDETLRRIREGIDIEIRLSPNKEGSRDA